MKIVCLGGNMKITSIAALVLAAVAVAIGVGGIFGLAGTMNSQKSQTQQLISQLQSANRQLAAKVATDDTALAKDASILAKDGSTLALNSSALAKIPAQVHTGQLGVCYQTNTETFSNLVDSTMDGYQFVDGLDVETPNLLNGVVSCPKGYQFVPVTPANNSTNSS